jgi:hypothetical protein
MELTLIGSLAALVALGCAVVSWGGRRFNLSSNILAVAFAVTAVSWLALLVVAISVTVRAVALARL